MRKNAAIFLTAFVGAIFGPAAHALVYTYDIDDPNANTNNTNAHNGGYIHNVHTSYDFYTEVLTWEYTIDDVNDGFWLVLNDGPNPKSAADELAIFYGDFAGSTNKLLAYNYNGLNNNASYSETGATLLDMWDNQINVLNNGNGTQTVSFTVDAGNINSAINGLEFGTGFNERVGIWFHPTTNSQFSYDSQWNLTSYSGTTGWYDTGNRIAQVPEPSSLALLGAGIVAFGSTKRRRARKA